MAALQSLRWPVLGRMARRQRQAGGGWAWMMLAGLLTLHPGAHAQDAGRSSADALKLLSQIQQAARKLDYAGVFMYQQGEFMQSSRVVHVIDGTGERERLEILDGQPREYLRHNDDVQCLMPERKTVLLDRRRGDRFPGLLLGDPGELARYYEVATTGRLHRVADRQCRVISINPRDKLRYGYRLCADVETNLLLKAQTLDVGRAVVEQVAFTSVRLGNDVDPAELASSWNTRDWQVKEYDMQPVDLAAKGWRIQAPAGFVTMMQVARPMGEATVSQLVLSDGLAAISVFIEPYDTRKHNHPPLGLARRGAVNVYGMRIADFWLTALGEVPVSTLELLADSIEYVPRP